jgi:hypothetical protein
MMIRTSTLALLATLILAVTDGAHAITFGEADGNAHPHVGTLLFVQNGAGFTNNPGGDGGGTCFGDSGGPVFLQDTPIIGAIVSFGFTPCIGVDFQFRIDTADTLNFIKSNTR